MKITNVVIKKAIKFAGGNFVATITANKKSYSFSKPNDSAYMYVSYVDEDDENIKEAIAQNVDSKENFAKEIKSFFNSI